MPSRGTRTSSRNGPMGTSGGSTGPSTRCCTSARATPDISIGWRDEGIESSPVEKDCGVLVDERLEMTQQCPLAAQKAKCILGYTKSSVASRSKKAILPLYFVLLRPHLDCCVQPWSMQHSKDTDLWEQVQ
ncbi:hypothetical protein WISP_43862 [Willisornis vidua]|uniref:Uncharacterized protein n=1 Tax=Willisornis vidua TaxID=1566151 RepID=A0ABQ9DLZ7_9PASS|nr:hypothetical protein WISP_43862 [Willisornis vidua]